MKAIITIACLVFACTNAFAQTEAEMKAWMAYMTTGEAHKMLAADTGRWKQEMTMWMAADAPPQKYTSMATNRMILGGRYQESISTGTMNGMPFEGRSTVGYNNASKKVESTWIDNMGTGIMYMEGPWDGKSKTMELKGTVVNPMDGKEIKIRETYTMVDDNTRKMEMHETRAGGKEFKSMEIIMTRQK